MPHKQQVLHELLKQDQEPFHLKSYISDRKSQIKKPPPTTLSKRKQIPTKRSNNLCFLSFQNSPDVRRSPFPSPAKSPNNAVFLHIPSRTAALLAEAAMRVQKPPKSQSKNAGFGLFGTFLKRLKDRSKSKKRAIERNDIKKSHGNAILVEEKAEENRISCSCSNRRLSSADWTENNEDKSLDFEASSSSSNSECCVFGSSETRFCTSPFRFSLHRSPSYSCSRTPDFCSPAASPSRRLNQDKEKCELSRNSENVQGDEEEEKEQCSPVSVLDPLFEDDGRESGDADEDDYDHDLECCYENVQRAKQQLMCRLRRFEKLAELDPIELERKLLEGSDEEDHGEREESLEDEPLSIYTKLVSDLIVEENGEMVNSGGNDVVLGRVCKRIDSWKQVEFNTIDMMVGLDLKRAFNGWTRFNEQVEETAAEIELGIFVLLVEELAGELSVSC
ncbi:hypothetical protein ACS0TY_015492 [Phlomoides rotata]